MKTKHCIVGSILLFALTACAIPGLSQPAALPTFDQNAIPTMVALTANAAMTQAAVTPTPFAPPDPSEATLEQLPDGSTKYTDKEAGFEITFPAGWLTLRPNSDEFNSALANEAAKNDLLRDQMEADMSDYQVGEDRLYSYPLRPDIEKNFNFGFAELKWDPDDPDPMDENDMGETVRYLESSGALPGFRADTAQLFENGNQIKLIQVGGLVSPSTDQGDVIPLYLEYFIFKPTSGTSALMSFTYLKDYKLPLHEDVMSVINSIKLLGQ
jgi:hypothetical protein